MSLWEERDEPVLRFLLDNPPEHGILWTNSANTGPHKELPGLTEAEFERAVETLTDAGYVAFDLLENEGGGGRNRQHFFVTGEGKQVLGEWPRFDALGQPGELARVLERLGEIAPTEEEASYFRRAAAAVRGYAPTAVGALLKGSMGVAARGMLT